MPNPTSTPLVQKFLASHKPIDNLEELKVLEDKGRDNL
jgi:hypothetical protein